VHLPTHLMLSWLIAHPLPQQRDRRLVSWAGLAPDVDGFSIVAGMQAYGEWHHVVSHGLIAGVATVAVCTALASDRVRVACLCLVTFHFHLLCDWLGSGYEWPIVYFWPMNQVAYYTPYGWPFASWQNWLVAGGAFGLATAVALRRGYSFGEVFSSATTDRLVVATIRGRLHQMGIPMDEPGMMPRSQHHLASVPPPSVRSPVMETERC
jgi:inner membrane protein